MRDASFFNKIPLQLWGPAFLLCTIAFASQGAIPFDLLAIALAGSYFCARWKSKGFVYSLVLLGLGSIVKHCLIPSGHLQELGWESSLALSFFIFTLVFEESEAVAEALSAQINSGKASLKNLEEELEKEREASVANQIAAQDKIGLLQKELEEISSEHSSILILNEVLRKTAARQSQETEKLSDVSQSQMHQIAVLQTELNDCKKEVSRIKASDALAIENQKLMKELNAARYEKEQTHLINETLARLHARENLKVKESTQRIETILSEKMEVQQRLQEELAATRTEVKIYSGNHEQAVRELDRTRTSLKELSEVYTQKNFLQERLQSAENEIALLRQKAEQAQKDQKEEQKVDRAAVQKAEALEKERAELLEQLAHAQEKSHALSQIEPLYKQLKKQFEEKNQILHQVRSELFKTDTELQKLQMEKQQAALQFNPVPPELTNELEALDLKLQELEEENRELQELITLLSPLEASPQKRKKKVKTTPPASQEFLF